MIKIVAAFKCLKLAESRIEEFVLSARAFMSDDMCFMRTHIPGAIGACARIACKILIRYFFSIEMLFMCLRRSGYRCLAQPSISAIPETTPSLPQAAVRHRAPYAPLR